VGSGTQDRQTTFTDDPINVRTVDTKDVSDLGYGEEIGVAVQYIRHNLAHESTNSTEYDHNTISFI